MSARRVTPTRILLGDLDPMARLGMSRLLADAGLEVLPDEGDGSSLVARAERLAPDAVVLALESDVDLGRRVRAAAPAAKVILWSRDETEMHVLDRGGAPGRVVRARPDALVTELTTAIAPMGDARSHLPSPGEPAEPGLIH